MSFARLASWRLAAAATLVWLGAFSAPLSAQDDAAVEILVQLRITHGPRDTLIVALARDSVVLLPLGAFLHQTEFAPAPTPPRGIIDGALGDAGTYRIDALRGEARRNDATRAVAPGDVAWRYGEAYVSTALLSWVFDVSTVMDWAELQVTVAGSDRLPVVRRLTRERMRQALSEPAPALPEPAAVPNARRLYDGAVLDWSVTSATNDPLGTSSAQLGFGAQILGGSLTASHAEQHNLFGTTSATRATLQYVWPGHRALKQLSFGDVTTDGVRSRGIRGAVATNAPFLRSSAFAEDAVTGTYAPGWDVELYRGDELVGFATADPAGVVRVPVNLTYGPNPLIVRGYGPNGRTTDHTITFDVPFNRLPPGHVEYVVAGGRCASPECAGVASVDGRYGVTSHLTAEAGAQYFWRDSLGDAAHPYAALFAAPQRMVTVSAQAVYRGFVNARAAFAPGPDLRVDLSHTRFDGSDSVPIFGSRVNRHTTAAALFWRPTALGLNAAFLQASATHTVTTAGSRDQARAAITGRVLGIRGTMGVDQETDRVAGSAPTTHQGVDAGIEAVVPGNWDLSGTFVRLQTSYTRGVGITQAGAAAGRQIAGPLRLDLGVRWDRGQHGIAFDLVLQTALPGLRAVSRNAMTADTTGLSVLGTQTLEGSVLYDRRTRQVSFGNGRGLGRAGVAGVVFLDVNANGRQDPDEPPIADMVLRVGSRAVTTDSSGRFSVWDLVPFEPTTLEVDTLGLPNPTWVPTVTRAEVRPTPNSFRYVAIAVLEGGDASGSALFAATGRPANGVKVQLVNVTTGDVTSATTFSDGAFYKLGLKPGTYEARLPADVLAALHATAAPVRFTIQPRDGKGSATDVNLRIETVPAR